MKKVFFDLEKKLFLSNKITISNQHVFLSGMARSGTTILLNNIYRTEEFASLTYRDMPFILSPNIWMKLYKSGIDLDEQERAHKDGIKIDNNSPEAFEEVFWNTFHHNAPNTNNEFTRFMKLVCIRSNKQRYLSKNNQNIKRISYLIKNYPNSKIIIPFREPLQQAFSLYNQHKKFSYLQKEDNFIRQYMYWIGHREFGLDYIPLYLKNLKYSNFNIFNHWLEQWFLVHDGLKQFRKSPNVIFVCYERLCNDNSIFKLVLDFININHESKYDFILSYKNINLDYDKELYESCLDLYKDL